MTTEFIQKLLRIFIPALAFMCCINIFGLLTREAHQYIMALATMVLFALLLRNIWLTLFVWLTVFLFSFFKFNGGEIYLTNIFYGCILYYLTKIAFTKEHIDYFIKIILWVLVINLLYGIVQVLGWDFIYTKAEVLALFEKDSLVAMPMGFMSNTSVMACFTALCIPLVASRKGQFSTIAAFVLFPMFFILHSSATLVAASIAFLFVMYFKYTRKLFTIMAVGFLLLGTYFFIIKFNTTGTYAGTERLSQWKIALQDSTVHPITGWGLDSFRSFNVNKNHMYAWRTGDIKGVAQVALWDNPHNLYVSMIYEFGIFAIILLGGYIRQCILWFRQSDQLRNVVALAGFLLAFFIVSIGHFPIFLSRLAVMIIPAFALYEISVRRDNG